MKLEVAHLTKSFSANGHEVLAVQDLSFAVEEGSLTCIVGPSGCGKTTLLNLIAGLERATAGEICVDGEVVAGPGPDRGMVFQEYVLLPWLSVRDNVEFGLRSLKLSREQRRTIGDTYIRLVGLTDFAHAYPHQLSGGMQQRVAIARALTMNPRVLLMDEPFAALDAQTRNLMQAELLEIWRAEGKTILFVTHNVDEAVFLADEILVLSARPGSVLEQVTIPLPRPRKRTRPAFNELREHILGLLATEIGASVL